MVFRYINQTSAVICERSVAVWKTLITTGNHLFTMFDNICQDFNLNWREHMIGQAYHGATSITGAYIKGFKLLLRRKTLELLIFDVGLMVLTL